jgi:hypothetical protein
MTGLGSTCPLDQAAAYRADLDPAGALAGLVPHWTRSSASGAQGGEYTPSGINRTSCLALCGEGEPGGGQLCLNRAMRDDQINPTPLCELPEEDP